MKEYKVVSLSEGFFSSKFDPEAAENILNEHASAGWALTQVSHS